MSRMNLAYVALALSFQRGVECVPCQPRKLFEPKPCLHCGKDTFHKKQCCSADCFREHKKGGE
jgi:hypothetical protein